MSPNTNCVQDVYNVFTVLKNCIRKAIIYKPRVCESFIFFKDSFSVLLMPQLQDRMYSQVSVKISCLTRISTISFTVHQPNNCIFWKDEKMYHCPNVNSARKMYSFYEEKLLILSEYRINFSIYYLWRFYWSQKLYLRKMSETLCSL